MDKMTALKAELDQIYKNIDLDMRVAEIGKRDNDDRQYYVGKLEVLREQRYNIKFLLRNYFGDMK